MAKKLSAWKPKGMNRDLSVSAFNPEFTFENRNLRLSTNENNTLLSWVNEKGTAAISLVTIQDSTTSSATMLGCPIGTAVLNHQIVVFTHEIEAGVASPDHIYKLEYLANQETTLKVSELYNGDLGFSRNYPLETVALYEADNIQKVYWTDNLNQPRIINIRHDYFDVVEDVRVYNPNFVFDFVPKLQLNEKVYVQKILGASGTFAPGVIQYALTYFNKYGQESNIFYVTPLHYISYKDRGASPEEKVDNAFRITVEDFDTNFEYLRIYSIQRTSINAAPICKRIQDIELVGLSDNKASYLDTGTSGDSIDPTELLYKGGEPIMAKTMDQKDGTLFLGNISTSKQKATDEIKIISGVGITNSYREFKPTEVSTDNYAYANQLTSSDVGVLTGGDPIKLFGQPSGIEADVPCAGFKYNELYRLGVQFQDIYGRWSEPVMLQCADGGRGETSSGSFRCAHQPTVDGDNIKVPMFTGYLVSTLATSLLAKGYKKIRGMMVIPGIQDRNTLCQGIVCPTVYTDNHRGYDSDTKGDKDIYAQSSWFFRFNKDSASKYVNDNMGTVLPSYHDTLKYNSRNTWITWPYNPSGPVYTGEKFPSDSTFSYDPDPSSGNLIRRVEIEGSYKSENQFKIDNQLFTYHSPDIEFDEQISSLSYTTLSSLQVGHASMHKTLSDISIQTETPTISENGAGFTHKSFVDSTGHGIVAGLFYEDYIIDDNPDGLMVFDREKSPVRWMVYPWNIGGSLTNDINRPADQGTGTSILKKKVISNLRYSNNTTYIASPANYQDIQPELYNSDEATFLKVKVTENNVTSGKMYQGTVDTLLSPDYMDGKYFAFEDGGVQSDTYTHAIENPLSKSHISTPFTSNTWWKTFAVYDDTDTKRYGLYRYFGTKILGGTTYTDAWELRDQNCIGDKYVSLVLKKSSVRMKYKSTPHLVFQRTTAFTANDNAMNVVDLVNPTVPQRYGGLSDDALKENVWIPCGEPVAINANGNNFYYTYGDTYYQRWDCLKTYPFTPEDPNQIVEIGSFMLETRVNIDGRYDRNRGQLSNINMTPQNFNLMNPVYSQVNNFFSYKILDSDAYTNTKFPNQVTWTKTHEAGADVDLWTNITLASTLEMDGDKGEINKITRFNDQLLAFQDTGLATILYNENVIISAQDGVPIEISNSDKVRGKKYISDNVGCSNKWSVVNSPSGVYFMDSHNKAIFMFNGQLNNISGSMGFNTWAKKNIPDSDTDWNPNRFNNFVAYYDRLNQDVLFINDTEALAYSERVGAFTSFYDYGGTPYFCNFDSAGIWITPYVNDQGTETTADDKWYTGVWKHNAGGYCSFFGTQQPYSMTLVGNPEPQLDKIFTNLEFRACVDGEYSSTPATPLLPFNTLETWNEYQHGLTTLQTMTGHNAFKHHSGFDSSLKRKFRIWRCDIPRDNCAAPESDTERNITRAARHPMDRMRNPWLYLKLMKNANSSNVRAEIHDVVMTYFA